MLFTAGCETTSTPTSGGAAGGVPSSGGAPPSGGAASPAGPALPGAGGTAAEDGRATGSGDAAAGDSATAGGASPADATASGTSAGGGSSIEDLDGRLDSSLEDFDDRVAGAGTESGEVDILDPSGRNTGGVAANVPVFEEADVGSGDVENVEIEQRAEEGYENAPSADTAGGGGMGGGQTYPAPEDIGDGQGDDIVLRQIREAAMKEPDPVLREKLWEEYRRIKSES